MASGQKSYAKRKWNKKRRLKQACLIMLLVTALYFRNIIHHNFFPKVAVVFYKIKVYGVILVSCLPCKIVEKH